MKTIHKRESETISDNGNPFGFAFMSWNLCQEPMPKDNKNSRKWDEVNCKKCISLRVDKNGDE